MAKARSLLWQTLEWPLIWGLAGIAFVLGAVGFAGYFAEAGQPRSTLDVLYLTVQLFVLQSGAVPPPVPWQLEVARLLAPGVAAYTASKALAVVFQEQLQLVRLRLMRNHAVICGLGRKGLHLVQSFRRRGIPVIVIEKDAENDRIGRARALGAAVLPGDARDPKLLARVGISRMSCLITVCGADAVNVEVAHAAQAWAAPVPRGLDRSVASCVVHILEPELCDLLREREFGVPIAFFNPFETGARAMLEQFAAQGGFEPAGDSPPHLLVVGAGKMGESLIVEAARRWWPRTREGGSPLRITVVDRLARERIESLSLRYPRLLEASLPRPVEVDVRSAEFYRGDFLAWSGAAPDVAGAFVCLDDESLALSAGLTVRQGLGERVPILVRTEEDAGLASLLRGETTGCSFPNVSGFGLLDRTCTPELVLGVRRETLARASHQAYVALRTAQGDSREHNPSMAPWDELAPDLRESSRRQADSIHLKLRAVGCEITSRRDWGAELFRFEPEEVERLARMEHDRYVAERKADGWRYAPGPKNPAKKTNPTLVPWDELSPADQDVDRRAVQDIPQFLAEAGFGIRRGKDLAQAPAERRNGTQVD